MTKLERRHYFLTVLSEEQENELRELAEIYQQKGYNNMTADVAYNMLFLAGFNELFAERMKIFKERARQIKAKKA